MKKIPTITTLAERANDNGRLVRALYMITYKDENGNPLPYIDDVMTLYTVQEWNRDGLPCGAKNYFTKKGAEKRFNRPLMNVMKIS